MAATRAGMPGLSRLKSTSRSMRLCPPPRWRTVMRPAPLRPLVRVFGVSRLFSGVVLVISSYVRYVRYRRAGDVGLTVRIPMPLRSLDEIDLVSGLKRHDRLLPVRAPALVTAHALELSLEGGRAHGGDLHVEDTLHGGADLDLVGVGTHAEGHRVLLFLLPHALLGHERPDEHLAGIAAHWASASSRASSPARSNTTCVARRSW